MSLVNPVPLKVEHSGTGDSSTMTAFKSTGNKQLKKSVEVEPLNMDTLYINPSLECMMERFKERYLPLLSPSSRQIRTDYLKTFLAYSQSEGLCLNELCKESMTRYFEFLCNHKNRQGSLPHPQTLLQLFCIIRKFLKWLMESQAVKQDIIPSDIYFSQKGIASIYERNRQQNRENQKRVTDPVILETYKAMIRKNRNVRFKPTERVLNLIKEYLGKQHKSLSQLTLLDYEQLREGLLSYERVKDCALTVKEYVHTIMYLKHFEEWLFSEGYISKKRLKGWNRVSLRIYIENRQKKELEDKQIKDRYYSPSELVRAYKQETKQDMQNHFLFNTKMTLLNFFFQYLLLKEKTVYTFTASDVNDYQLYLLKYEYKPGYHYRVDTQLIMVQVVKRFYDWLLKNQYCGHHPLKHFNRQSYKAWLQENIKPHPVKSESAKWYDELLNALAQYEKHIGFTEVTRERHKKACVFFFEYLDKTGIEDMRGVTRETLRHYLLYLGQCRNEKGKPFSTTKQIHIISGLKNLCEYMEKYGMLETSLSIAIEYPKEDKGLPTPGLSHQEAKMLIESATGDNPRSLRNRVFFELLYSSGVRSNEMCQLKTKNIDLVQGLIRVDVPKGGKQYERVVPIGKITCYWLERYYTEIRSCQKESPYFFLNAFNRPFRTYHVLNAVKTHLARLPLKKRRIVTHSFRVGCATEMLKKGANVKIVQEQLGHKVITSTEKYLRLVPTDLKKAHEKYHPRK